MSDFFEPPSPPPEPEPPQHYRPPPWIQPPAGTLPGVVPVELIIARTEKVAVCVTRLSAYPSGFEVDLVTMSSGEDELDPMLLGGGRLRHRRDRAAEGISPEVLRFGVQFADGAKATNTGAMSFDFDKEPKGPVLHPGGGSGGGGRWQQSFWVWPLPPAGPLILVCEWPAGGIALSRLEIDGQAVLDAASRAQTIFSDEHLPRSPGGSRRSSVHQTFGSG